MSLVKKNKEMQQVVNACCILLNNFPDEKILNYVNSRIPINTRKKFQFGRFPTNEKIDDLLSLVDKEILNKYSIVYERGSSFGSYQHGHFSDHNLVFPIRDCHGNITGMVGRSILTEDELKEKEFQKYKYSIGICKDLHCFNLDFAKDHIRRLGYAICVEGQIDAITAYHHGIKNVVSIGGANLSQYHMYQLLKYTDTIFLMFDNDEAGVNGGLKAKKRFEKYAKIGIITLPNSYKDIDSLLRGSDADLKSRVLNKLKELHV